MQVNFKKIVIGFSIIALGLGALPAHAATDTVEAQGRVIVVGADGASKLQFESAGSVADAFAANKLELTSYRTVNDEPIEVSSVLKPRQTLLVYEKGFSSSSEQIVIPFNQERVDNADLFIGETEVSQVGRNGLALKTVVVTENKTSENTEETISIIEAPVTEITQVGTKKVTLDTLPKDWRPGDSGLSETTRKVRAALFAEFPELTSIGGYRNCDWTGEHCTGRALDIMIPNYKSNQELGNRINAWAKQQSDAGVINVCWSIWQQSIHKTPNWNRNKMENRGGDTLNHFDHVHLFLRDPNGGCSTQSNGKTWYW